jgi:broad specificity phosphatase PhoE
MTSMEVLFIRHGETDGNVAWRHQHPDTRLNSVGKEQVEHVVARVRAFAPTHLITSTNLRAVETARVIAEATGLIPDTSALFEELRRPTFLIGRRFIGFTTAWYILTWFYGRSHADGESHANFVARLLAARTHLESLPPQARVVVVSHSVFINLFVEHRCRTKSLSLLRAIWRFLHILLHKNTGQTRLLYAPDAACAWHIVHG